MRYIYLILACLLMIIGHNMIRDKDRSLGLQRIPRKLEVTRKQLGAIAQHLHAYTKSQGHYPTNDQGLLVVKSLTKQCNLTRSSNYYLSQCRVRDSGILTRWGEPFIYENRRGFSQMKFADSGASIDTARTYSVRVDNGIYVWSLAAQHADQTYRNWTPKLSFASLLVWIAVSICVILFLYAEIRHNIRHTGNALTVLSLVKGLIAGVIIPIMMMPMLVRTCYEASIYTARTPELTGAYKELILKYRNRGIISDTAYKKIMHAMENGDENGYF